ncbi:MAG: ATP-binding protein, partial [Clostridiales bacterium]
YNVDYGHTLNLEIDSHCDLIGSDMELASAFSNLITNAIKYTPKNSEILITATKVQNQVLVEIFDQGEGIPDTIKPKIFEMFYTAQNRIGDSRRSLGLGLALSKSIITAHGGSLSVRDNTPYGSVFSFTLPAAEVTLHE